MASPNTPHVSRARDETGSRDDVGRLLDAAGRVPLLTADEEIALATDIEAGREATERLGSGRIRSERTKKRLREAVHTGERSRRRFILANTSKIL